MLATILTLALSNLSVASDDPTGAVSPVAHAPGVDAERSRKRQPSDRVLRQRAIGLGVTGSALGLAWVSLRTMVLASDLDSTRRYQESSEAGCIESCHVGVGLNTATSPLLIAAAGFAGGSLHAHGRWLARNNRGLGRSTKNGRVLVGTGVALMVGAFAGLGLGIGLQDSAETARGRTGMRELGWWSATALGSSGAALTGLGHGIIRGRRDRRTTATFSPAPILGKDVIGLSLSGRF